MYYVNKHQFLAYGGDISCNFESELWFKGHCNWIYSASTKDYFEWSKHPDQSHFIEVTGEKEVALETLGSYICDGSNSRSFGMKFSSQNASVSTLRIASIVETSKICIILPDSNWSNLYNIIPEQYWRNIKSSHR